MTYKISITSELLTYLLLMISSTTALSISNLSENRLFDAVGLMEKKKMPYYLPRLARRRMTWIETNDAADNDDLLPLDPIIGRLILQGEDGEGGENTLNNGPSTTALHDNKSLFESLKSRRTELAEGIGRRYITRTQKGFLNVHDTYDSGPYAVDNIVGRLEEGQIVTSISKIEDWIEHDAGGWSISKFGGFTWLEPLVE